MAMDLSLPIQKEMIFDNSDWKIVYFEENERFLFNEKYFFKNTILQLLKVCEFSQEAFCLPIKLQSVYFSAGVFPKNKKIYILSHRASREIILTELFPEQTQELKNILNSLKSLQASQAPTSIELVTLKNNLKNLESAEFQEVDKRSLEIANEIGLHVNNYQKSFFEKVSDLGLNLTAQYDLFRIHILKFLAILPSLSHDKLGLEVKRVLLENLRRLIEDHKNLKKNAAKDTNQIPESLIFLLSLFRSICLIVPSFLLAYIVRFSVSLMAKRFIAGENIKSALLTLKDLKKTNRDATLDQLGELVVSEKEADVYYHEVLKIINGLDGEIELGQKNPSGINRAHVSIKVSALSPVFKPHAFDFTYSKVSHRLRNILQQAHKKNVFINIDAEHYHYRDLVFDIYAKVLLETPELHNFSQTGIVLQCYLQDASLHLDNIIKLAEKRKLTMPVRLVKGAYWDAETIEAEAHGFDAKQFLNKEETDIHFRQMIFKVLSNYPHIQLAVASHNIHDHAWSEALREKYFPKTPVIEHQVLHMTYEALSHALAKMNYPVRNYMPIGGLLVGMAYLVRRIMENSSQVGILTQMRKKFDIKNYISPSTLLNEKKKKNNISYEKHMIDLKSDFKNINPVLLYNESERNLYNEGFLKFSKELGFKEGAELNGELQKFFAPFSPDIFIGESKFASIEDTEKIIKELSQRSDWKTRPEIRISSLLKASSIMLQERYELSYLIVMESGKTFSEALGDVDEAIDFLNFYAREEQKLLSEKLSNRNLVAVIAPWNFPLAIPCGMVAGALVAGNHVILKSAEQTTLIAWELIRIFYESGVPHNVLKHVPGKGETIGKYLVEHPSVEAVVFTGSRQVGEWIYKATHEKQSKYALSYQPKVIAEMGGKNAIIVTANAELDETISGILYSAFAHAGQKCSAASRIIVDSIILEKLEERIREAIKDIQVGKSSDPSTFVNSLINMDEKKRLIDQIKEAGKEAVNNGGKIIVDRSTESFDGAILAPAVFSIPAKLAFEKNSFACKELFGPVIHLIPYENLDQAIKIFNTTDYALTGGIFSQSQDDIDYVADKLQCGNFYVNRPNTGARVGIEPFGGFKMSGTGPKAGSPEYVKAFHKRELINSDSQLTGNYYHEYSQGKTFHLTNHHAGISNDSMRFNNILRFLEVLENNDVFTKNEKEKINSNKNRLLEACNQWRKNGKANTKIPGQLSFNDYKISKNEFIVITDHAELTHNLIFYILSAMNLGLKVTILVRHHIVAEVWNKFINLSLLCGFNDSQLELQHLDRNSFIAFIHESKAETFYFDTDLATYELLYKIIFSRTKLNYLPQILTSLEGTVNTEDFFSPFVYTRSFAVNIMRHGAPLSLDESTGFN
jgi:RHH-type proline utilization regulon transcriptional repressor/proline dehydrogenase/delta 1-pyrroline-5-carboxylate dehydrogenase